MRLDFDVRIETRDGVLRALDLESADVRRVVNHLPLKVGERHDVVVDDAERADAGRREILQKRRAEPARADDEHACSS